MKKIISRLGRSAPGREGVVKGRGSGSNQQSRYLDVSSFAEADGWEPGDTNPEDSPQHGTAQLGAAQYADVPAPDTRFFPDHTKKLITTNRSPDLPFSQSINPYKGCEHGCIYCFARPTHAYLDLSPGLDFETKIFYKTDVKARLTAELAKPAYRCRTIAMGTNTDPYQPGEKQHLVIRQILECLAGCRHPVSIVTKSALVLRDIDILATLAKQNLVNVYVSVTTLDNRLKTKLEPRTAGPAARLKTITTLSGAGIPTGAMIAPVIPFINDAEIEALVKACAKAGAQTLGYILLRLPLEVKPLFEEWLSNHYPQRAQRVMSAIRSTRGGAAYQSKWHKRMVGEGPVADLIRTRFVSAVKKAGLAEGKLPMLSTDLFIPPRAPGDSQLDLF